MRTSFFLLLVFFNYCCLAQTLTITSPQNISTNKKYITVAGNFDMLDVVEVTVNGFNVDYSNGSFSYEYPLLHKVNEILVKVREYGNSIEKSFVITRNSPRFSSSTNEGIDLTRYSEFESGNKEPILHMNLNTMEEAKELGNSSASYVQASGSNGIYQFSTTTNSSTRMIKAIDFDLSRDYEVETSFAIASVEATYLWQDLLFASTSAAFRNNLEFGFNQEGSYSIHRNSDVIHEGQMGNFNPSAFVKLTIRKIGDQYFFFINEKFIFQMPFEVYGNIYGIDIARKTDLKLDYFRISYLQKRSQYNDAPVIVINEAVASRNFNVVRENSIEVSGRATDNDGIASVLINGVSANVDQSGNFKYNITMTSTDQIINVVATDNKGKSSTKVIPNNSIIYPKNNTNNTNNTIISEKRVALIFGNSNYNGVANLGSNPINDANDISVTLKSMGFQVILKTDADLSEMNNSIREFGRQNKDADVALFYFAGHGMQIDRNNYLLPVGVNIQDKNDVSFESVSVSTIQKMMESSNSKRLNLLVLDACRNNPFKTWDRGGDTGLADMKAPSGTLIAYSTSPGSTASNGNGRNGLYTGELIKQLKVPQRIEDVFINTRIAVEDKSGGNQSPWELARLRGKYFLAR